MNKRATKILILTMGFLLATASASTAVLHTGESTTLPNMVKNGQLVHDLVWEYGDDVQQLFRDENGWMEFVNHSRGYAVTVPDSMTPDLSLSAVRAVLEDKDTQVEIYYDDFNGTVHSAYGYISYGLGFLNNRQDHHVEAYDTSIVNGMLMHKVQWRRTPLPLIENDKPYYTKAVFIKNSSEVYTILVKSAQPSDDHEQIIKSFRLSDRLGHAKLNADYQPVERNWNEATERFYDHYFVNNEDLAWGIFKYSAPRSMDKLSQLESELEYEFPFLLHYKNLEREFPMEEMENARLNNRHVVLTLQTKFRDMALNERSLYPLLEGAYDHVLTEYAENLKAFGDPVLFRLNNEMNGDWCTYSAYYTSMDTDIYKESWRYVYRHFEEAGVDNVIWVWNPHDESFPGFAWNHYLTYYPGDEYVDIIGLTGYNPGTYFPGERWRPFQEIYPPMYREYSRLFKQPFMITEFGSNSVGGDKVEWIGDMFEHMPQYTNIRVAIWWNGIDRDEDGNPGRIYRLDETPEIQEAFRRGLTNYVPPPLPPERIEPEATELEIDDSLAEETPS